MAVALPGQLNLDETPSWGSRSVDCFEKIEQIGEGTYGYGYHPLSMCRRSCYFQSFSFIPLLRWPEDEGFVLWPEDVYIGSERQPSRGCGTQIILVIRLEPFV